MIYNSIQVPDDAFDVLIVEHAENSDRASAFGLWLESAGQRACRIRIMRYIDDPRRRGIDRLDPPVEFNSLQCAIDDLDCQQVTHSAGFE